MLQCIARHHRDLSQAKIVKHKCFQSCLNTRHPACKMRLQSSSIPLADVLEHQLAQRCMAATVKSSTARPTNCCQSPSRFASAAHALHSSSRPAITTSRLGKTIQKSLNGDCETALEKPNLKVRVPRCGDVPCGKKGSQQGIRHTSYMCRVQRDSGRATAQPHTCTIANLELLGLGITQPQANVMLFTLGSTTPDTSTRGT